MNSRVIFAGLALLMGTTSQAAVFIFQQGAAGVTFANNGLIPDGERTGWSDTRPIENQFGAISKVEIALSIAGGYNGDLFAYVTGPSGSHSILLNRVGKDTVNPFGYSDGGLQVTFTDQAAAEIHSYQAAPFTLNSAGQLLGDWQPDARSDNPFTVTSQSSRSAPLSAFNGSNPNGDWTLFVADLSAGADNRILSWSLTVTTVPEPAHLQLATVCFLFTFVYFRKRTTACTGCK
jgi:subtilisin-like proprotein convertase family protein